MEDLISVPVLCVFGVQPSLSRAMAWQAGVSVQVSGRGLFLPETCLPTVARRAVAGHPKPETSFYLNVT